MSTSEERAVRTFSEICGTDEDLSIQILRNNNFDIDMAVQNFLAGMDNHAHDIRNSHVSNTTHESNNTSTLGLAHRSAGSSIASSPRENTQHHDSSTADELVPSRNAMIDSFLHPLRWLFNFQPQFHNPDQDARQFLSDFEARYGTMHPRFVAHSYATAVRQAFQQGSFLLVYLHSSMHDDTTLFCSQTLCKESITRFFDTSLVAWAGSVEQVEGYSLSLQLQAHSFPFMALLVCKSEREVVVADRIQGHISEVSLAERLRAVQSVFQYQIMQLQEQQRRRAESINLREEQDREFRESERQDRLRQEQREREEAQRRQAAQEAAQRTVEAERAAALAESEKADQIEKKRKTIPVEPGASAEVTTLRLQLPSGEKVARRFHKNTKVQELFTWLEVLFYDKASVPPTVNFSVSTAYPKVDLTDLDKTLDAYGLHPKGTLYVRDLDL